MEVWKRILLCQKQVRQTENLGEGSEAQWHEDVEKEWQWGIAVGG